MIAIIYSAFFIITMPLLFSRNRLSGIIYAILFLYSIFAIVGYLYFPGMSESILAYFGDRVGYIASLFIFLSMALFFIINMLVYKQNKRSVPERGFHISIDRNRPMNPLSILIVYSIASLFSTLLYINYDNISWIEVQKEQLSLQTTAFLAAFKLSVGILCFLYISMRTKISPNWKIIQPAFALYIFSFLLASFKLGNRTDPAALIVGILFFESSRKNLDAKIILQTIFVIIIGIIGLSTIEFFRYENSYSVSSFSDKLIKNDYFAPAHMLFAAIAYNFVNLTDVVESNTNNALILQNYPYLQQFITDLFNPGVATRSAGYAFYIFSEGYMAFGFLGFIYNAVIVSILIRVWNSLSCTDSKLFNIIIMSILATMSINVCRTQSSQYIKIIYTYFIPIMILVVIILGVRVKLQRRIVRDDL